MMLVMLMMMRVENPERRKSMLYGVVVLFCWFLVSLVLLEKSEEGRQDVRWSCCMCCWILGLVFGLFAIPISRYQWIDEVDEVKVEEEYCDCDLELPVFGMRGAVNFVAC